MKKISGILLLLLVWGCQSQQHQDTDVLVLKEVFKEKFLIGSALNRDQITGNDNKSIAIIKKHFNTITAENVLKWENVHPQPGVYDFNAADSFVEFGQKHNMFIVGHVLVWHSQTPGWVFEDDNGQLLGREVLLQRMKDHILNVVGRYKGKIHGWDVINEAFDEEGAYRKTKWFDIIGPDYIDKAFQWAHEADPGVELYYNDYNMWYAGRRDAVIKLVQDLKGKQIAIHGIGLQGHWGLDYPPQAELEAAVKAYSETGLKVMITELDIDVLPQPDNDVGAEVSKRFDLMENLNPYKKGLPDSVHEALSKQYSDLFKIFLTYQENVSRVTFWGAHDGVSWKNNWPIPGRTSYPMLFDRECQPKPAFYQVIKLINED